MKFRLYNSYGKKWFTTDLFIFHLNRDIVESYHYTHYTFNFILLLDFVTVIGGKMMEWSCKYCTFINNQWDPLCKACGAEGPYSRAYEKKSILPRLKCKFRV